MHEFGWVAEIIRVSPWLGLAVLMVYLTYRAVIKISDQPLSIATWVSVLGGKDRRKDAKEIVEMLCNKPDDPPDIELFPDRRRRKR